MTHLGGKLGGLGATMDDRETSFGGLLSGLKQEEWMNRLARISEETGGFHSLGAKHFSTFIADGETLLVTFETIQGIRALDESAQPLGWEMVRAQGWSHLAVISDGDTWFREKMIFTYFDQLSDGGFFDKFERVLFYGAGPCGYAAAAFSVAAPGARVVAIQPQATLAPEIAGWDVRFVEERRRDFSSRYAFAPDMLEAAEHAYILFDPTETLDAMHASLFARSNVTLLPLRHMGTTIQTHLLNMGLISPLLKSANSGALSKATFAKMMRARRDYPAYLTTLLAKLTRDNRQDLAILLCQNVTSRMMAPKFARRLKQMTQS